MLNTYSEIIGTWISYAHRSVSKLSSLVGQGDFFLSENLYNLISIYCDMSFLTDIAIISQLPGSLVLNLLLSFSQIRTYHI